MISVEKKRAARNALRRRAMQRKSFWELTQVTSVQQTLRPTTSTHTIFPPYNNSTLPTLLVIQQTGIAYHTSPSFSLAMAPKDKHQSSLTSFFASKGAPPKQTTKTAKKSKENAHNLDQGDKTKEESSAGNKHAATVVEQTSEVKLQRKKRRVIDDQDDEEEDKKQEVDVTMETKQQDLVITKTEEEKQQNSKQVSNTSATQTKTSTLLPLAPKDTVLSDEMLLQQIPEASWPPENKNLPYLFLCQALKQIEETTKRLQIQGILTNRLRQVLLRNPADLYPLIYLASNSVAPAYECVELGIGDSLLIKAIGEATGTNANMVKSKYEAVGDLGTVAMAFKGKQKTLGGFFKSTSANAKPKLTAREVLDVFRSIANTKGNQSQKFKVDQIKRLLVKASDAIETKYIIRGLQGKLRIGLAESTVLIALAHALALTTPATVTYPTEMIAKGTWTVVVWDYYWGCLIVLHWRFCTHVLAILPCMSLWQHSLVPTCVPQTSSLRKCSNTSTSLSPTRNAWRVLCRSSKRLIRKRLPTIPS